MDQRRLLSAAILNFEFLFAISFPFLLPRAEKKCQKQRKCQFQFLLAYWLTGKLAYYEFPIRSFLLSKIRNLVKNKSLDSALISDLCMEYEIKQTFMLGNKSSFFKML